MRQSLKDKFNENKGLMAERSRFFRSHCLPILTSHPNNDQFKRDNYLGEIASHQPEYIRKHIDISKSSYTSTRYLNKEDIKEHEVFVKNGYVIDANGDKYSSDGDDTIVVMTPDRRIFSQKKGLGIQHSSYNAGGFLLFAGFWVISKGNVVLVHAESGHYETPITSLQNFFRILKDMGSNSLATGSHSERGTSKDGKNYNKRRFFLKDKLLSVEIDQNLSDGSWQSPHSPQLIEMKRGF